MLTMSRDNWSMIMDQWGLRQLIDSNPEDVQLRARRVNDNRILDDLHAAFAEYRPEVQGWYEVVARVRRTADPSVFALLERIGFEEHDEVVTICFPERAELRPASSNPSAPSNSASIPRYASSSIAHRRGAESDLDFFYPTSVLSTARDIISLWVVRMVLSGLYCTGRVPFQHVFIHPTIQDAQGRRMSKSAGNGVDPLDLIELYGADAMRFTLASMAGETQDVRIPVQPVTLPDGRVINSSERFELGRNFCNKLWNVANGVVFANLPGPASPEHPAPPQGPAIVPAYSNAGLVRALDRAALPLEDQWILSRLAAVVTDAQGHLDRYEFSALAGLLYAFFWNDFCDWYVELAKPRLFEKRGEEFVQRADESARTARQVLAWVLDQSLRLLHPLIPFITEALWQRLNELAPLRGIELVTPHSAALVVARWPRLTPAARQPQVEQNLATLQSVITALRDTLARINTNRSAARQPAIGKLPGAFVKVIASNPADPAADTRLAQLRAQRAVIERLGRCERVEIGLDVAKPAACASHVLAGIEVYVPLAGLMDSTAERQRLDKELADARAALARLEAKLANPGFVEKAPPAVIEQERARLAELADRISGIQRNLAELE
jgi:valyl-tRNA synthetase